MKNLFMFLLVLLTVASLVGFGEDANAALTPDPETRADLELLFNKTVYISDCPFQAEIANAARKYNLPMMYLLAVARGESFYNEKAVSSKGAVGVMQIMPELARDYGVDPESLTDPRVNIETGSHYLSDLYGRFGKDPYLALAAYYCGPGGINGDGTSNPECDNYVRYIGTHLQVISSELNAGSLSAVKAEGVVIGVYNYFLSAQKYVEFLSEKLPVYQFDLFRINSRSRDHYCYQYQVLAAGGSEAELCRELERVTGFNTCAESFQK